MFRFIPFLLVALIALAGCGMNPSSSPIAGGGDAGYQFGDVSKRAANTIGNLQDGYCANTSPLARTALLLTIRARVPDYPPSGLCTDAEQALADEITRRVADLPEGATVTLEQARQDQRRYQEQGDADEDPATPLD